MKKSKIALAFCLITVLLLAPLSGMDDHGANVVVTRKGGFLARGELLAVKRNALVVSFSETSTGESVSVAIEDIENVEVIMKSKVGKGMLWGGIIGASLGAGYGFAEPAHQWFDFSSGTKAVIYGVLGLGLGVLIGAWAGSARNENFRFNDLSKEDREAALLKLSEYAALKGVR